MHTVDVLEAADFSYEFDGRALPKDEVMPEISIGDRLGIVMGHGAEGIGAGNFILASVISFHDSLRELKEEFKEREQELQRERDRLDDFASVVSHDLRNPLRVAEGNLEHAIEDEDWEALDAVAQAHDRMDMLIEDLLALANAGEAVGETESVDLAALAETCWQNVETPSASFDIQADGIIQADETRLQQLLENLLRNAIEHGGEDMTVTVGDSPDGFYLEDDGPGIPPAERENVLDPGYSTREDGTGFGLNIVREIAEAHDWQIGVTESSEGGARFEFTGVEIE